MFADDGDMDGEWERDLQIQMKCSERFVMRRHRRELLRCDVSMPVPARVEPQWNRSREAAVRSMNFGCGGGSVGGARLRLRLALRRNGMLGTKREHKVFHAGIGRTLVDKREQACGAAAAH